MSRKVYSENQNNTLPRNQQLVEVPNPYENKGGRNDNNNSLIPVNNNTFGGNNTNYNNNNNNNQFQNPNDPYATVPRGGSKTKTIIIKDEKGNEISRIISSKNNRVPLDPSLNNFVVQPQQTPSVQNQFALQPQQNQFASQPQQNQLVLQPQQYLLQSQQPATSITPLPVVVQQAPVYGTPVAYAPVDYNRGSIINEVIPEERPKRSSRRSSSRKTSSHYKTLEKARTARQFNDGKVNRAFDTSDDDDSIVGRRAPSPMISTIKPVDPRKHIFCCAFCEKANTTTCYYCWRLCGFPIWFTVLILAIFLLIVIGLAIVVALFGANVIQVSG